MTPKVSVLIAHYDDTGEREEYLQMCLRSVSIQSFQDYEIRLVITGKHRPAVYDFLKNDKNKIWCSDERMHFPAAIAKAYSLSSPSEYILLLNNDAVLDSDFLKDAIPTIHTYPKETILNGLCNSDAFGFLYHAVTGSVLPDGSVTYFHKPQYRINELKNLDLTRLFKYPYAYMPIGFNPFYATLMRRSTYDKVGGIFEDFLTNKDDLDFSLRANKLGIQPMVAIHTAVFHFGGVTSSKTKTQEEEAFNNELFFKRHGIHLDGNNKT